MKTSTWQLLAILLAGTIVLAGGFYLFTMSRDNQPSAPIREVHVEFQSDADTREVEPYTVCELDEECAGAEPPRMSVGTSSQVKVSVPDDIASTSWRLLSIYDDPAANDELVFRSGEASEATLEVSKDDAQLVVAEISVLTIDHTDDGEEIPVVATWSVAFD